MGCRSSLGSQREGGFRSCFKGSAWNQLPAAHCPLPVALEFRRCVSVKKEVGEEGNGLGGSPEGEVCWVLCLQAFISLAGGNLRGVSGEGFSRIFISFPGVWWGWGRIFFGVLFCFTLSLVCLAFNEVLLFVPLTLSILGFSWHKWHYLGLCCLLPRPGIFKLCILLLGRRGMNYLLLCPWLGEISSCDSPPGCNLLNLFDLV